MLGLLLGSVQTHMILSAPETLQYKRQNMPDGWYSWTEGSRGEICGLSTSYRHKSEIIDQVWLGGSFAVYMSFIEIAPEILLSLQWEWAGEVNWKQASFQPLECHTLLVSGRKIS